MNGAGFCNRGISSADEELNALQRPRRLPDVARHGDSTPLPACADFDLALPLSLQPQPKTLLPSKTPLTDFYNRKPKLEHAHERPSPRLQRAFHALKLR